MNVVDVVDDVLVDVLDEVLLDAVLDVLVVDVLVDVLLVDVLLVDVLLLDVLLLVVDVDVEVLDDELLVDDVLLVELLLDDELEVLEDVDDDVVMLVVGVCSGVEFGLLVVVDVEVSVDELDEEVLDVVLVLVDDDELLDDDELVLVLELLELELLDELVEVLVDEVLVDVLLDDELVLVDVLLLVLLEDVVVSLVEVVLIDVVVVVGTGQHMPSLPKSAPIVPPTKWPCSVFEWPRFRSPLIEQMSAMYEPCRPSRTSPFSATMRSPPHSLPTVLIARKRTLPGPGDWGTTTVAGPALLTIVALPTSSPQIDVSPAPNDSRPPLLTRTKPYAPGARSQTPFPGSVSSELQSALAVTMIGVVPHGGNGSVTPHATAMSSGSIRQASLQLGFVSPSRSSRIGVANGSEPGGAQFAPVLSNVSKNVELPRVSQRKFAAA